MSTLIDKILSRQGQNWSPQDLEQLAREAASRRDELLKAVAKAKAKLGELESGQSALGDFKQQLSAVTADQGRLQEELRSADALSELLQGLDERTRQLEQLTRESDGRLQAFAEQLASAEQAGQAVEELVEAGRDAERQIADFRSESSAVGAMGDKVRSLQERFDVFSGQSRLLVTDYKRLDKSSELLREEMAGLKKAGERVTQDLERAQDSTAGVDDVLSRLTAANELGRQNEEQLHKLNALSSHVAQKTGALNATKQALERAEGQSREVNELVWKAEERIKKLEEESELLSVSNDKVGVLKSLVEHLEAEIERVGRERKELVEQGGRVGEELGREIVVLQGRLEQAKLLSQEVEVSNQRVVELSAGLNDQEERLTALRDKDQQLARSIAHAAELSSRVGELGGSVEGMEERVRGLETFGERFGQLEELGTDVERMMQSVSERSTVVAETDRRLTELATVCQQTRGQLDDLKQRHEEVERARETMIAFREESGETQVRIRDLRERLVEVESTQARLSGVQGLADDLLAKTAELEPRVEFVASLEARLNHLDELSHGIDARLEAQLAKHSELESMRVAQQSLGGQLTDLRELAASLHGSKKLSGMQERVDTLEETVSRALERLERSDQLAPSIERNEERAYALAEQLETVSARLQAQDQSLEAVAETTREAVEFRDRWHTEVSELEAKERELLSTTDDIGGKLEALGSYYSRLDDRQAEFAQVDKKLNHFDSRMAALEGLLGDLDGKIDGVNSRHELVEQIRREVDSIFETCEQSRESALEVLAARERIAEAQHSMSQLDATSRKLNGRLERLQARCESVEEAEFKIDTLYNIMSDIDVNLDNFREQQALIEHVGEKLAQVDFEMKRADLLVEKLRDERQLATRIQQGLSSLRGNRASRPVALSLIKSDGADGEEEQDSRVEETAT